MAAQQSTIQIYGRVRPLKKNSKVKNGAGRYWISRDSALESSPLPKIGFHVPRDEMQGLINHQKENHEFSFNQIFDVDASQDEIFDVVAKPVVDSAMMGYNGTIFAYGQTGSGKTFTITGGAERYQDRGLIPRTLQHIFKEIQKDTHTTYHVHVSYLEIYNEIGYDLLDSERDAKKLEDLPKVTLQEDSDENIHLRNLSVISAANEEEALNLLFVGDTNRMIAETPSNPASSRSHCIFIISISSRKNGEDVIRRSKLHLVDLAGSERVSKTGIDGSLLREARHINLSLHYLEQVIIALHEASKGKRAHVPYRNSMMTSVLRDSLGGNCKTTMIATLAVEDVLIEESISTCRFAKRVALISNKATLNEELDPKLVIARLKQEIARLKAELAIARGEGGEYSAELPDYEKARVRDAVYSFLQDSSPDAELVFADFKKIQYAFMLMKERICGNGNELSAPSSGISQTPIPSISSSSATLLDFDSSGLAQHQIDQIEKLKRLAEHRDNEIHILVGMIAKLKKEIADGGKSLASPLTNNHQHSRIPAHRPTIITTNDSATNNTNPASLKASIPILTTEKARAFEIFKQSYPASEWIENQKNTLKTMYAQAKKMGEYAQSVRSQMKTLKEQLSDPEADPSLRTHLASLVSEYKTTYAKLKDYKTEVEHLQHLLEQGRVRMTRDFEAWFVEVFLANNDEQRHYKEVEPPTVVTPPQSINAILLGRSAASFASTAREAWTPKTEEKTVLATNDRFSLERAVAQTEAVEEKDRSSLTARNGDYIYQPPSPPSTQNLLFPPKGELRATDSEATISAPILTGIPTARQYSFTSAPASSPSTTSTGGQKWTSSAQILHKQGDKVGFLRPFSSMSLQSPPPPPPSHLSNQTKRPVSASIRTASSGGSSVVKDIEAFYQARDRLQARQQHQI